MRSEAGGSLALLLRRDHGSGLANSGLQGIWQNVTTWSDVSQRSGQGAFTPRDVHSAVEQRGWGQAAGERARPSSCIASSTSTTTPNAVSFLSFKHEGTEPGNPVTGQERTANV